MTFPRKPFIAALIVTMAAGGLSVLDVSHATATVDESWLVNTVNNHEQRISGLEGQVGKNSTDIAGLQSGQPTSTTTTVVEQPTGQTLSTQTVAPAWTPSATPVPTPGPTPAPTPKPVVVDRATCWAGNNENLTLLTYSDGTHGYDNSADIGPRQQGEQECPMP